jgi:acyl-CoA thioester hydrolase
VTDLWTGSRVETLALEPQDFSATRLIPTRWRDNDAYGHINNALYYEFFDTAINRWLLERLPNDPVWQTIQMFVAESGCRYLNEIGFPAPLLLAHSVAKFGRSSVTYDLGIFDASSAEPGPIAALGRWVHVFVDTTTHQPVPIPSEVRAVLDELTAPARSNVEVRS